MKTQLELEDVHYHKINEFSNDFDVKDIHDDLNICERCNIIVMWDTEMYWQGECEESYNYCMGVYEAVCDELISVWLVKMQMKTIQITQMISLKYTKKNFIMWEEKNDYR